MSDQSRVKRWYSILAIVEFVATAAVVAAVSTPTRRVILYGDSLAFESRDHFALALARGRAVSKDTSAPCVRAARRDSAWAWRRPSCETSTGKGEPAASAGR
jgi:hypothetical protein